MAVPQTIAYSRARGASRVPARCAHAATAHSKQRQLQQLQQQQRPAHAAPEADPMGEEGTAMLEDPAGSSPASTTFTAPCSPPGDWQQEQQEQQLPPPQNPQQWSPLSGGVGGVNSRSSNNTTSSDGADSGSVDVRTPSPDARAADSQDQLRSRPGAVAASPAAVVAPSQSAAAGSASAPPRSGALTAPRPAAAAPRPGKVVRFAPGPLLPNGLPHAAPRAPVSSDGHPASEGCVAVPVRQLPFCCPTDLTRSNILVLEELLGPENAPSLGRLKRRIGLLAANRPPRVHLTTVVQQPQRQQG